MQGSMNACFLVDVNRIEVRQTPIPSPGPGEALLKVKACTVCGSDIKIWRYGNKRVKMPSIIGHEVAGEVVEVGPGVEAVSVGDRVQIGADVPGYWNENVPGKTSFIDYATGHEFAGGFAEYMLLNEKLLQFGPVAHIPESLSYEEAALAEPLACAINGLELAQFSFGKSICVIGLGPIGCMILELTKAYGAGKVFAAQRSPARLEMAREFRPDARFVATAREDLVDVVMKETDGLGVDLVMTTAGSVKSHEDAINIVGHRGYVNLFGGLRGEPKLELDSNIIHYKECFVMGSHGSLPRHNKMAVQALATGLVSGSRYISRRFPLTKIQEAFDFHESRAGMKVAVMPELDHA
jgi:L-iditol 2-dehydrogenase